MRPKFLFFISLLLKIVKSDQFFNLLDHPSWNAPFGQRSADSGYYSSSGFQTLRRLENQRQEIINSAIDIEIQYDYDEMSTSSTPLSKYKQSSEYLADQNFGSGSFSEIDATYLNDNCILESKLVTLIFCMLQIITFFGNAEFWG